MTPTTKYFRQLLAAITAVGLTIQVVFVAIAHDRAATGDAGYYFEVGRSVAQGKGFISPGFYINRPTAYHPPGQVLLSAALRLLGLDTPQGQRYALCVLGAATIVVTALLVRRLVSPRAGLFAALLLAVYPPFWINARMLMSEPLFLLAFALALWFAYAAMQDLTLGNVSGLSLAIAVATSARPESILLYGLIVLPVIISQSRFDWKRRIALVGLAALFPLLIFAPWAIYNQRRFHAFVPMSTGAGPTLLQGNCSATFYGPRKGYYNIGCLNMAYDEGEWGGDEASIDTRMREAALKYMRKHVTRVPTVVVFREVRMWGVYDPLFTVRAESFIERGISTRLAWAEVWSYWIVALLAVPGFFIWRRRRIATYPLLAMIGTTAFVAALSFGLVRYRVGADLCLVIFASTTLDFLVRRVQALRAG